MGRIISPQSVGPGSAVFESPGRLSEMQIPGPSPGPTEPQPLVVFQPALQVITMTPSLRITWANDPDLRALTARWDLPALRTLMRLQTLHFPKQVRVLSRLGFYCRLLHLEQNSQTFRGLLRPCTPRNSERSHGRGSSSKARSPAALL